jgi:hypothetical protein
MVETAGADLIIAHPSRAAAWLTDGIFPELGKIKRLLG